MPCVPTVNLSTTYYRRPIRGMDDPDFQHYRYTPRATCGPNLKLQWLELVWGILPLSIEHNGSIKRQSPLLKVFQVAFMLESLEGLE